MNRLTRLIMAVAAVLAVLPIAAAVPSGVAEAAPVLDLSKEAPSQVLAGDPVPYTLRVENTGTVPMYNISFRDQLPLGVTYSGPTAPASAGEPQIVENLVPSGGSGPAIIQQTLIWSNIADLQIFDSLDLDFSVTLNATPDATRPNLPAYVVGSTVSNTASTYGSANPRVLQRFDANGVPIANANVTTDTATGPTTTLTAIEITKDEPSPEGELLRGVHEFVTTYTLSVEVTPRQAVNGVVVTDLLPASLEFLGCGDEDNTSIDPSTGDPREEYPTSGPLGGSPVVGCIPPNVVETVPNPVLNGVTYPGVYTRLIWNLGIRPAGSTIDLPYAAGIPMRANELFAAPVPPINGPQGANLDNNTGASTRELTGEGAVTNIAAAGGVYQGPVAPSTSTTVVDTDTLTRTIEDVRIIKTANRTDFLQGAIVDYSIQIDASEYVDASDIVLTDQMPNGVCPIGNVVYSATEPECARVSPAPSPLYDSVTLTPGTGGYTIVFRPIASVAAGASTTATYSGYMREKYEGGPANIDGRATVSGDTFTNTITSKATTEAIPELPPALQGPVDDVPDSSSWTLYTDALTLDKQLRPRIGTPSDPTDIEWRLAPGEPCPTTDLANEYLDSEDVVDPIERREKLGFRLGDEVCFLLRINFDTTTRTRNPVVTDFLPTGMNYVPGSAHITPNNNVDTELAEFPVNPAGPITWNLGTDDPNVAGTDKYAGLGSTFELVFKAKVVDIPDGDSPEVTGNLMKLRSVNTAGQAQSYRDRVELAIVPAPAVDLIKGIASIDNLPAPPNGPNTNIDGLLVREGSAVVFRVDVSNLGNFADFNDYTARGLDVWDVLPAGITCTSISNITNFVDDLNGGTVFGTCTNPLDPLHPNFALRSTRSAIRWTFPVDKDDPFGGRDRWAIQPGATRSVTYTMTIPTPTRAGVTLTNDAAVRSFKAFTNVQDETATYFPANNVDTTVTPAQVNAPEASDPSNVFTPSVTPTKSVVSTSIVDLPNNNLLTQAVPGELITYRYAIEIPSKTSVFDGVLTDTLPAAQLTLLTTPAPIGRFYPDASDLTVSTTTLPPDFVLSATTGTLTFPSNPLYYTNNTLTTQRFEVEIVARVNNTFANQVPMGNTARFRSNVAPGGASADNVTADASVNARQPAPILTKTPVSTTARGGDTVTFTLNATNTAGRPPLYDAWIVDCIPAGLTFDSYGPNSGVTLPATAGTGGNGCATGTTRIAFALDRLGASVPPNPAIDSPQIRTYSVRVNLSAVGGDRYTNSATLSGSSLNDGTANSNTDSPTTPPNANERTYSNSKTADVNVPGATTLKSVTPSRATIGERVQFTVDVQIPVNTNFYQAAIIDLLPPGLVDPQFVSATCVRVGVPVLCPGSAPPNAIFGPFQPTPPVGLSQQIGFYFGDIAADTARRDIRVVYTARVADIATNMAGTTLDNSARTAWDQTNRNDTDPTAPGYVDPTAPGYVWGQRGTPAVARVTVLEPAASIGKTVSNATPEPGEVFTYTLRWSNATGPNVSAAYNGTITDTFPVGVVVDSGSFSLPPTSFVQSTPTTPGVVTWGPGRLPGPLAPGATTTITYTASLAPSGGLTAIGYVNTARLNRYESLPTGGHVYSGNPASATVTPEFPALTTTKTAVGDQPTYLGTPYTWRVTVTNNGAGTAAGIAVIDTLPVNWSYVPGSAIVTFPSPTPPAQREPALTPIVDPTTATWSALGQLTQGQSITIEYSALPDDPAVLTNPGIGRFVPQVNTAVSSGTDLSGASSNGSGSYSGPPASASTRIDAVDLLMLKTSTGTPVAGQPFDWFVDVSNQSLTDTAVGPFTVVDTIPTGVTYVSATGSGWSCGFSSPTVTCTRSNAADTLPPTPPAASAFPRITVRVNIPSTVPSGTSLTNTATVDGRTYELDPTDNTDTDVVTVATRADLRLLKGRTPTTIVAGRPLTYTLDVTNLGPSVSRSPIRVTDTLPSSVTYTGYDNPGAPWTCVHNGVNPGGVVTCTLLADLGLGQSAPQIALFVNVLASASPPVPIVNSAVVTATTTDPNPDNDRATNSGTPTTSADLALEKNAVGPFIGGAEARYRFRVDNFGPSDAAAVVSFTDTLPAGLRFDRADNGAVLTRGTWTCAETSNPPSAFTCSLAGPLAVGDHAIVEVIVDVVTGPGPFTFVNSATVTSPTEDLVPGNNTDGDRTDFVGEADLSIDKSSVGSVLAGDPLTYTLSVTNNGPSDSLADIVVSDALPSTVRFVSAVGTDWSCIHTDAILGAPVDPGGLVTCTRTTTLVASTPPAAPTQAPPITLIVDVLPGAGPGTIENTAVVDGTTTDPDPDNNDDTDVVTVDDLTDLTLVKTADPTSLNAGLTTTFTFVANNAGPSQAESVTVTDELPAGLTIVSIDVDPAEWTCTNSDVSFICSRPSLLPGDAPPIEVLVRVDSGLPASAVITNIGVVSTSSPETDDDNNEGEATVTLGAEADLAIAKSHPVDPVTAGTDMTFTLKVDNLLGPSDAIAPVEVVDTLPPGFLYVSNTGPWLCDAPLPVDNTVSQIVTCTYNDGTIDVPLPAGVAAVDLVMTVRLDPTVDPGPFDNVARVSSPTLDPNIDEPDTNNEATDTVNVVASADLAIVKSHVAATVRIGDPLTFTIQVRNSGPSEARNVVVADTIPAGLTYGSVAATGWTCTVAAPAISCALDASLAPNTSAPPINVTATVEVAAYPTVVNTATVTSTTPDPVTTNNTSRDTVVVPPQVDLAITKTHRNPVVVGEQITYTVKVVNNGPTRDPGPITVTDVLPSALTPTSASGAGLSCTIAGQRVTCRSSGSLAIGASLTITIRADVEPSAYPTVTNTATVSTPSEDTTVANNTATDVAEVEPVVVLILVKALESQIGTTATWTFTVTNEGPNATVEPIVLVDKLPAGLAYVSASGNGWTCTSAANVVTCTYIKSLAVGAIAPTLRLVTAVSAAANTTIKNTATVTGGGPDTPAVSDTALVTVPPTELPNTGGGQSPIGRFAPSVIAVGLVLLVVAKRRRPASVVE